MSDSPRPPTSDRLLWSPPPPPLDPSPSSSPFDPSSDSLLRPLLRLPPPTPSSDGCAKNGRSSPFTRTSTATPRGISRVSFLRCCGGFPNEPDSRPDSPVFPPQTRKNDNMRFLSAFSRGGCGGFLHQFLAVLRRFSERARFPT